MLAADADAGNCSVAVNLKSGTVSTVHETRLVISSYNSQLTDVQGSTSSTTQQLPRFHPCLVGTYGSYQPS